VTLQDFYLKRAQRPQLQTAGSFDDMTTITQGDRRQRRAGFSAD